MSISWTQEGHFIRGTPEYRDRRFLPDRVYAVNMFFSAEERQLNKLARFSGCVTSEIVVCPEQNSFWIPSSPNS